jgi:hypothetical protein
LRLSRHDLDLDGGAERQAGDLNRVRAGYGVWI